VNVDATRKAVTSSALTSSSGWYYARDTLKLLLSAAEHSGKGRVQVWALDALASWIGAQAG
jgi:hypothetical protein